jgi:hypothetical protein
MRQRRIASGRRLSASSWSAALASLLVSKAVPGPQGTQAKLGLTTAFSTTGVNGTANKAALAECPPGTSIISGAVEVVDQNGSLLNGVAAISYSGPVVFSGQYWEGAASRTVGSTVYGLNVIAFCMAS